MVGFNSMLRDADPDAFARAIKIFARDTLSDPHEQNERIIAKAKRILSMTHEELVEAKPGYDAQWDARHKKT